MDIRLCAGFINSRERKGELEDIKYSTVLSIRCLYFCKIHFNTCRTENVVGIQGYCTKTR